MVAAMLISPAASAPGVLLSGNSLRLRFVLPAVAALFLLASLMTVRTNDVARGFDELAHASYVAQIQEEGASVRLERLTMLDPVTFRFTERSNYLNHPPLYYRAMAVLGPRLAGHPDALVWHRLINVALVGAAMGLLLAAGLALARTIDESLIVIIGLFCVPMLAPLSGSVNNDNLGFLAGGLLVFGAQRFLARRRGVDLAVAGAGVALAGAAKLTALLLCGGFFVAFLAIAWRQSLLSRGHIAIAIGALAAAAIAPLLLWWQYGSPAPNTPAQVQGVIEAARQAGWADQPRLGLVAYVGAFLAMLLESWRPLLDERSLVQSAMLAIPLAMALIAGVGTLLAGRAVLVRRTSVDPASVLVISAATGIAVTLLIHIAFSYRRHLDTGWMMDAYARYYLPLVVVLPLAGLILLRALKSEKARRGLAAFLIGGPILFGVLG